MPNGTSLPLLFFGETNAGKSTIIESLRILFDETTRRQLLQNNQNDLHKAEQELRENLTQLRKWTDFWPVTEITCGVES